jgi:hypothetical protein
MRAARTIEAITARICCVPAESLRRGDVSIVTLLTKSGYQAVDQIFGVAYIQEYVRIYPELIDDWSTYSGDKRTSGSYFHDGDPPSVGYCDASGRRSQEQIFSDRSEACAQFIKYELDAIRSKAAP